MISNERAGHNGNSSLALFREFHLMEKFIHLRNK